MSHARCLIGILPTMAYIIIPYNSYVTWVVFHPLHTNHQGFGEKRHWTAESKTRRVRFSKKGPGLQKGCCQFLRFLHRGESEISSENLIWKSHERYPKHPETNSKFAPYSKRMVGIRSNFLLGNFIFRGRLLVLGKIDLSIPTAKPGSPFPSSSL